LFLITYDKMSDIFNQQSVKSSFAAALKAQNKTVKDESILQYAHGRMEKPVAPPAVVTYSNLAEYCFKNKLPVFKPRAIPELIEEPAKDFLSSHLMEALGGEDRTLTLPTGEKEFIPKYRPTHTISDPLETCVNTVAYKVAGLMAETTNPDALAEHLSTLDDVIDMYNTVRFSTGTLDGQMTRFLQGTEVRNGKNGNHANKTLAQLKLTPLELAQMLYDTLPIEDSDPPIPLNMPLSKYVYTPEEEVVMGTDSDLPKINLKGAAGLPYLGKKKRDVGLEALVLADNFLKNVSSEMGIINRDILVNQGESAPNMSFHNPKQAAHQFSEQIAELLHKDFWWLTAGLMFPKGERYEVSKLTSKTRNIWSAPYPTHLMANMISNQPNERGLNFRTCDTPTPSLSKFSATQGGIQDLVEMIFSATEPIHLIYADNIYLYYPDEDVWYSIDLTKGEANITREMAMAVAIYLLTAGWTDTDNNPLFNFTWAYVALFVIPLCTIDSIALIGNLQLRNPGQGSGNAWTFLNNHMASTIVASEWIKAGRPHPRDALAMEKIMNTTGIDFKLELTTTEFKAKLSNARDNSLPVRDSTRHRVIVEADMLGWDITHTEHGYTPVLSKERLIKSFVCPQPASDAFGSPQMKLIHKYVQAFGLYSVGAWAYPALHQAVNEYVTNYWGSLVRGSDGSQDEKTTKIIGTLMAEDAHSEMLSMLNPDQPLHEQDWPSVYYGYKAPTKKSRKRVGVRPHIKDLGLTGTGRQWSDKLTVLRRQGKLVAMPAYDKLVALSEKLQPQRFKELMSAQRTLLHAPGGLNKHKVIAKRRAKDTWDDLALTYDKTDIARIWEGLILGKTTAGEVAARNGIEYPTTTFMSYYPPPAESRGAALPELYEFITGIDRESGSNHLSLGEKEDYNDAVEALAEEAMEQLTRSELLDQGVASYLSVSEALLQNLQGLAIPREPKLPKAKTAGEAADPIAEYHIGSTLSRGTLARRTGMPQYSGYEPPPSRTQKRRTTRKRNK